MEDIQFERGDIWEDPKGGHRVGCLDATDPQDVARLMGREKANLAVQDPPYNQVDFKIRKISDYIEWSEKWVDNTIAVLSDDSNFYIWMGADQNDGFQPLPDFMIMMRDKPVDTRSFVTMRNQRGYGTQKNWMAVRQELLYYVKGNPRFEVQYTDIPKKTKGYYKKVNGKVTENIERSKSDCIRPGNVWYDIQQVFYKMHENVKPCKSQKPLASAERIIESSSSEDDLVIDFFSHSGTTLLQSEISNRRCYTMDMDPEYCRLTVKRLQWFRETGKRGWQNEDPNSVESFQSSLF